MNKTALLLGSTILLGLASCNKSDFEGYTKAENGLHYKFFSHDEKGVKPTEGDGVSFKYVFKLRSNDSILVNSALVSQDGSGVTRFVMPKSSFVGSIEDALMMMSASDSASFIVSADSFFLKTNKMQALPPFVKPNDHIQVDIKLVEVKTKKELEENQKQQEAEIAKMADAEKPKMDQYLVDNKIDIKPTASGLVFIETMKGKGKEHPKATDEVTVHYTGTLLDGTKFDSSVDRGEPTKFPLNAVIPGWTEGIQLMTKGSKARLIIPSALAYGPAGSGPIPPYSTLIFDVELIDFKAGEPMQPGM